MPRAYEHSNRYEREVIAQMLKEGGSWVAIAERLGRSASSVWREVYRNRDSDSVYRSGSAHRRSLKRRMIIRRKRLIVDDLFDAITKKLKAYWSPEQVEGRARLEGTPSASAMTIYRFLDRKEGQSFKRYLRGPDQQTRQKRSTHKRIHDRVMIDDRPSVVADKCEPGHWEGDTIQGPKKSKSCVMSMVERTSHYLVARLLRERNAENLNRATAKALAGLSFKTVTVDNGMEFAGHKKLEQLTGASVYFAHEKKPWQRGLNEQINGLLRQFFPKGTDFRNVSPAQLRRAESLINNRPRKKLGYQTPREVAKDLVLCT